MIRFDMSEFMEKYAASRLVGSPPGYVGFDEGGELTEKIRRKPYSVVLFDEIEKAHPDVFNMMLQVLEDGILTDSQGRRVSFRNAVIIMTSNVGARLITEKKNLGFMTGPSAQDDASIKSDVMNELRKTFKPEFLNRVDDIIVFHRLSETDIAEIAGKILDQLVLRVRELGIEISFTPAAVEKVSKTGFDPVYGARPLRRAIQSEIEDRLAEQILSGQVKASDRVQCDVQNDEFVFLPIPSVSLEKESDSLREET